MRYGHFDDGAREYVVERPDTPLPWLNYLGSGDYVALVTNTGGGYSFFRDARLRRLTRYRYNAPTDAGGRHVYLRDDEAGTFWLPCRELAGYRCRHGLGYTAIESARDGVAVETTFVVPPDATYELWRVRVRNARRTSAALSLFAGVEFCLWDAHDDATNLQRNLSVGEVEVEGATILHVSEYRERRDHFAWFTCSAETAGFDTQRDAFLGPGRGFDAPAAVVRGACSDSIAHGWQPCGVHHVRLVLAPGEEGEIVFALGYSENARDAKFDEHGRVDKRNVPAILPGAADAALAARSAEWDERLGRLQVETPNVHVDRMVNVWNQAQCMVTFDLSRSASLFETGVGRGMGFRDSSQDVLGFVHLIPERARERILDLAATQLPSGGAYHQYQPLTKRGNDAIGSGFNDDPLWLVLATCAYLKETGDRTILDEAVPYDNAAGSETPLREHLDRALSYTVERIGPHGLPLIGRADWNDCLNLNCFSEEPGESFQTVGNREGGVAESVFIAALFVLAARELGGERWAAAAAAMEDAVRAHGWDGAWFRRAYDHFGAPVGSAACDEGQIFVEPQGMCAMAGIGLDDGRAAAALASVRERLLTGHGVMLVQPAYTRYRLELGEITSYPPGYKENAGVFCHTNPWIVIAETRIGDGEAALDLYLRTNPSAREDVSDVHRCEPYVYAQMIAGRDAATHGEAKNSWLTGAAAWSLVAVTQWILGIRPEHDGLRIDPCLPRDWEGFTATRVFRGATYRIRVRGSGRVDALLVDGERVEGSLIPLQPPGAVVEVETISYTPEGQWSASAVRAAASST
ncbi:MAG TPA: glycosyl hydrolase family 65 protein [Gaiellaceae bacterium]